MKILVVGDSYMPIRYFQEVFEQFGDAHEIDYLQVDAERAFIPTTPSERKLTEYQGARSELAEHMGGVEALVVQGAPVTDMVLAVSDRLKLVCCARGGPVNIDADAVTARGLPLVITPGKNADAVADLTLAFLVMLARGLPAAQRFLDQGHQLKDNWEGARFIGSDLRGHTLGLIGYGQVGQRVASRALPFGVTVVVYDPFVELAGDEGVEQVSTLPELLGRTDFVSLHARATAAENANLINAQTLALMKPGSYLLNTARESLVDIEALDDALAAGRLAGAALDVLNPGGSAGRHRLLRHENVIITPHIGGATHETLIQGASMIAADITRFVSGDPMLNVSNRAGLRL